MRTDSSGLLLLACFALARPGIAGATDTASQPSPAPTSALKEIGHVHAASDYCRSVIDHASFSTATALANDSTIVETADYLRKAELDEDAMAKPKAIADMQKSYELLMARTRDALAAIKELRALADQAPTAEQKAAILAYANALGGALYRQETDAREYRQFGVFLEANDPVSWQDYNESLIVANVLGPTPGNDESADARDRVPKPLAMRAKSEADHLIEIHELVLADETTASSSIDAAFDPCKG